ncbi:glycoside hydrolase family 18 protein [Mycena galopus ATCC 62051]|nr:glycoside hydrolase family 18 protein [Mycena galopus ATCC 62051]
MFPVIKSAGHTTASDPRPHIIYKFEVKRDGIVGTVHKRYSEFVALHAALGVTEFNLPPKRLLVTTFIPSAWVDDALIAERTAGLEQYLTKLAEAPRYRQTGAVQEFLALSTPASTPPPQFELEDAVPSTLSRKTAKSLITAVTSFISAAYYPSWTDTHPPERLDYSKFDILFFGAKKSGSGTRIVLSVGGWSGSGSFHEITGSSANRAKFVSTLSSAVSMYGLDGIDIDWEYPNAAGAGNAYGSADAANFLVFLKDLRTALGSSKIISAAVTDLPWLGANGHPLTDVSEYAAQLTYANLMNYDINGPWSTSPGPNAPCGNLCGNSSRPAYSAESAYKQWTAAKFPASKLLLGLPLYGYVYNSTKTALAEFRLPENEFNTEVNDNSTPGDVFGEATGNTIRGANKEPIQIDSSSELEEVDTEATATLSKWWGQQIPFNSLVASGALVKDSDGKYEAGAGFTRAWDSCSKTPFLYSAAQKTVVSYDDTSSLGAKSAYAKSEGMAGCFTWSLDQDDGVTLQNAIRQGLGK